MSGKWLMVLGAGLLCFAVIILLVAQLLLRRWRRKFESEN